MTKKYQLQHFGDAEALAAAVAIQWLDQVGPVSGGSKAYCVALAGGRIAGQFFAAAAALARTRPGGLGRMHFFWGDERCVPPEDDQSNFKSAREKLLGPLGVPAQQIHRVRGEQDPERAAAAAAAELEAVAGERAGGQPVLDLVFLGLGEEGHTASLFPGEPVEVMESPAVYRVVRNSPKPPPVRITLGYPALAVAREVWMLASGPGKETALRDSLTAQGKTPFGRVLNSRAHTRIFTDLAVE
jgi:6-phosphogluconolactonase